MRRLRRSARVPRSANLASFFVRTQSEAQGEELRQLVEQIQQLQADIAGLRGP